MFKKILSFTLAVLLFFLQTHPLFAQNTHHKKINIAVFDFDAKGISKNEAGVLTERFRSVLVATKKFNVVERQKINLIMDEIGLQQTGTISEETLSKAGRLLGVNSIIIGTVGKIGDLFTVDLRIVKVETGKVVKTISQNTNSKENLIALLERLAKRLAGIKTALKKYEVKMFSMPGKSSVYVDGKYIGLSPLIAKLSEGIHKVTVKHENYKEWTSKINVDKKSKIIAKLEKTSSKKTWLWVGLGTLVAAGGITAAVLLGGNQQDKKEAIGTPPTPPAN